jgi:hypothetical protein
MIFCNGSIHKSITHWRVHAGKNERIVTLEIHKKANVNTSIIQLAKSAQNESLNFNGDDK